ncbi:DUF5336 domain-containing protein [Actinokineospora sp. NBRC 105648]|uniref:DUF5336 domain-containing protein n=1 Tax=Actinokineospora sp. NBRC 105648 TaxID=3032206 RepID=UPI0024A3B6D8|nr:DUF5336 domain-containing protein [Actinokineospora sp. NBRC 105648]GLZ43261.1 hypothetical protein Acsp05_68850 [Actinokineospora sp. NBRC 105648]
MTYPGGAPGGYPGPGPQQPPQGFGPPPPVAPRFTLAQTLHLVVAVLGTLNLFLGFAPLSGTSSFYEGFVGWIPGLLFVGGLLALQAVLPGDKKAGILSVAVTLGVTLSFLFSVFAADGETKAGGIMVLIFGLLQSIGAVVAFLYESGVLKPPQPRVHQHPGHFGQPGGYNPPSGQFQQPGYGQPPVPPTGQQTTYAPQPGQFGQPPLPPPGTPPGGYPQQQG